ncbi:MAG: LysR substrate-binding domain-containing protein [Pigmentiphaga sp.]|nr:LysR substrate-binding domain-containing protein [Pigmentiphaga sp.]
MNGEPQDSGQRPKLNLNHLAVFQVVADCGSIRAAARQLGFTQPAVTYVMRELERSAGAELLHRGSKGIVLTELGVALYRRAQLLLSEMRRTEDELEQLREGMGGSLCVAFSSGAAMRLMVPTLNRFRRLRPGVHLELHEITVIGWQKPWQSGVYDLAVISELDDVESDDGLQRQVLFTSPMVVTAREGHPLAGARSLLDLRSCAWVMPGYGPQLMARLLRRLGAPPPQDLILCQSLQFSLSILRGSDTLTLYSSALHEDPLVFGGLVGIPVQECLPSLRVSLVVRNPASLTPAARLFIQCLTEESMEVAQP